MTERRQGLSDPAQHMHGGLCPRCDYLAPPHGWRSDSRNTKVTVAVDGGYVNNFDDPACNGVHCLDTLI